MKWVLCSCIENQHIPGTSLFLQLVLFICICILPFLSGYCNDMLINFIFILKNTIFISLFYYIYLHEMLSPWIPRLIFNTGSFYLCFQIVVILTAKSFISVDLSHSFFIFTYVCSYSYCLFPSTTFWFHFTILIFKIGFIILYAFTWFCLCFTWWLGNICIFSFPKLVTMYLFPTFLLTFSYIHIKNFRV